MREKHLHEDLADLAYKAESDHEVQMARAELYKVAKYAIKLHDMLKNVSEQEGLEGWVQSKITKAADYISSVYHHMDYEVKFDEVQEAKKSKPDYIDIDGDGDKKEPMKKAVKDKEDKKEKKDESYKSSLASMLESKVKVALEGTVNSVGNNQGGKVGLSSTDTAQPFSGKVGKKAPKGTVPPTQKLKALKGGAKESTVTSVKDVKAPVAKPKKNGTVNKVADARMTAKKPGLAKEGAKHGNDKMYDKCWDGYKKVPGKKRGEKGSCVKA